MDANEVEAELPERRVTVIGPGDDCSTRATVHCPLKAISQAVERCRSCPRLLSETPSSLVCAFPPDALFPKGTAGELVPSRTIALDAELSAGEARVTLERAGLAWAPVVDDNAQLLGQASVDGLARLAGQGDAEVDDAVQPSIAVNQRLPAAQLAALMVERGLQRVAVVDDDARLVGVVSALELVRWFVGRRW